MENIILYTKQDYIREHRKMWNWIMDNLDDLLFNSHYEWLSDAKSYYIDNVWQGETLIHNDCFCCEYASSIRTLLDHYCYYCPLKWYDNKSDSYFDVRYLCESDNNNDSNWYTANSLFADLSCKPFSHWNDEDNEKYNRLKELCKNIAELEEI